MHLRFAIDAGGPAAAKACGQHKQQQAARDGGKAATHSVKLSVQLLPCLTWPASRTQRVSAAGAHERGRYLHRRARRAGARAQNSEEGGGFASDSEREENDSKLIAQ